MTDETLLSECKTFCRIDYEDDEDIIRLMLDATLEELQELIPGFDPNALTARQKLLIYVTVKDLYDNREKYGDNSKQLSRAISSMLLKEMYKGEST